MKITLKKGIWQEENAEKIKEFLKAQIIFTLWIGAGGLLLQLADLEIGVTLLLVLATLSSTLALLAKRKRE